MRRILSILTIVFGATMLACSSVSASPPAINVLTTAADTGFNISIGCPAAGQNASCQFTVRDSISHVTLATAAPILVGAAWAGHVACTAPLQPVLITATAVGVTSTGKTSAPSAPVAGSATCPDLTVATTPVIVITIVPGP